MAASREGLGSASHSAPGAAKGLEFRVSPLGCAAPTNAILFKHTKLNHSHWLGDYPIRSRSFAASKGVVKCCVHILHHNEGIHRSLLDAQHFVQCIFHDSNVVGLRAPSLMFHSISVRTGLAAMKARCPGLTVPKHLMMSQSWSMSDSPENSGTPVAISTSMQPASLQRSKATSVPHSDCLQGLHVHVSATGVLVTEYCSLVPGKGRGPGYCRLTWAVAAPCCPFMRSVL